MAVKEGMEKMPKKTSHNAAFMSEKGDRWTPVARTPHYFNAKTDTSAFDRFFNSGITKKPGRKTRLFRQVFAKT